jgi:hypothetical protein
MRLFADAASSIGVRVAEGRALPVGSALRGRRGQTALLYEEEGGEGERQTSIASGACVVRAAEGRAHL